MVDIGWILELVKVGKLVIRDSVGTAFSFNIEKDMIAVGHPSANTGNGLVEIFKLILGEWVLTGNIYPDYGTRYGFFGICLSLSGDGSRLAITSNSVLGKPGVIIYYLNGANWECNDIIYSRLKENTLFGKSVSMDLTGGKLLIGNPYTDTCKDKKGSAYLYTRIDTKWSKSHKFISKLDSDISLGCEVLLNSTGDIVTLRDRYNKDVRFTKPNKTWIESSPF